ncbi:hypothetical protein B0H14DRAFT_2814523 [Mycena olivaceomarginata]|nr:hypothetical protein B0H14DRAFT_2814523 [Mycena olivaceomarginata]
MLTFFSSAFGILPFFSSARAFIAQSSAALRVRVASEHSFSTLAGTDLFTLTSTFSIVIPRAVASDSYEAPETTRGGVEGARAPQRMHVDFG